MSQQVGEVHVGVEVDSKGLPAKLAAALKSAANSAAFKSELTALKEEIKKGVGAVEVDIKLKDVDKAAIAKLKPIKLTGKIDKIEPYTDLVTIPVQARIKSVIQPKVPPKINVVANISRVTGAGRVSAAGGGGGRDNEGFQIPPKTWIKALKGAGSGGFFEGLTTGIAHLFELGALPGKIAKSAFKGIGKGFEFLGGMITKAGDALSLFSEQFFKFGGMIAKAGGGVAKIGAMFGKAAGPIGMVVQLLGAFAVLVAVVQLAYAISGALTLLAGAAFNAAAGLLVFVPAIVALGAGALVAVAATKNFGTAFGAMVKAVESGDPKDIEAYNKALGNLGEHAQDAVKAAKPLVESFKDMRKAWEGRFFEGMAEQISGLKPLLDSLRTPLDNIATAAGNVVDKILAVFQQPTVKNAITEIFTNATPIIENFGSLIANVVGGVINILGALSGVAVTASDDVKSIGDRFFEWSKSDDTRQKLIDFFTNAWNIAKQVGDIIGTLGQIMISVFTQSQGPLTANNGILQKINEKLNSWLAWVQSEEGQQTIKRWFEAAEGFIQNVADALGFIWDALKRLNSPEARLILQAFIESFKAVYGVAKTIVDALGWIWQKLKDIAGIEDKTVNVKVRYQGPGINPDTGKPQALFPFGPGLDAQGKPIRKAAGGLISSPTNILAGEAGLEAIIPLHRPLGMIDPSVRDMAAMIRREQSGKNPSAKGGAAPSKTINVTQNITPRQSDPAAVAMSVMNRLAATTG